MKIVKKVKAGSMNDMKSLIYEIEALIFKNGKENYPNNWNEDSITRSFLIDIRTLLHQKKIHLPGSLLKTSWSLYMLNDESVISDFAIYARITYHDGQINEGIVFFDVEMKDPGKNTFSSMKKDQVKRINTNSPHSQLLLFDYDNISGMAFPTIPESVIGNYPHSWNNWTPYTYAAVVPTNLFLSLGTKNTSLYKVSIPFSYQVCYRYFYGLDFDYQKTALDIGKGYKTDKGNPKYLILLSVAHGGAESDNEFDFERGKYVEI